MRRKGSHRLRISHGYVAPGNQIWFNGSEWLRYGYRGAEAAFQ